MKNSIMIDLETLDVLPSSVIVSVGVCWFNSEGVGSRKEWKLDVEEQLSKRRTVSWSTLKWWLNQSDDARKDLTTGETTPINIFIEELYEFIRPPGGPKYWTIWANSPTFDCVMLHNLAKQYKRKMPWNFWEERDVRTLVDTAGISRPKSASHGALQDAVDQAEMVREYFDNT